MSKLSTVQQGPKILPPRMLIWGDNKIGKTTFASGAPNPLIIQAERGADAIGVDRTPPIESYAELLDWLRDLATEDHDYRTVVIDSLSKVQDLLELRVQEILGVQSMEQVGYGKAYVRLAEEFRGFLDALDYLRDQRGMGAVIIGHSEIRTYAAPDVDSYDRLEPKGHKKIVPLVCDWSDVIGHASYKVYTKQEDEGFGRTRTRGLGTGERVLHLEERPAYKAGNRYSLPPEIPLSWDAFAEAFAAATA